MDNPFKLEKLKITAYSSEAEQSDPIGKPFVAMFNPETYKEKYEIEYAKGAGVNNANSEVDYAYHKPSDLELKLILDGTFVSDFGLSLIKSKPSDVKEQFKQFLELAYKIDGELHEPRYLKVEWGEGLKFFGRLRSVEVTYTSFDRDGKPLRAELDVSLISQKEAELQMLEEHKSSPDLTHTRIVRSGDTLPYLCQQIYGSSSYYLKVAQVNELNNFRRLSPGQEIIFPPIEK